MVDGGCVEGCFDGGEGGSEAASRSMTGLADIACRGLLFCILVLHTSSHCSSGRI